MNHLLSVAALAEILNLAPQTIYNRNFAGEADDLPPRIKLGSRLLFDPDDVQAWLAKKKQASLSGAPTPEMTTPPERRKPGRPTKAESIARRNAEQQQG